VTTKHDWFLPIEEDNLTLYQALELLNATRVSEPGEYSSLMARFHNNSLLRDSVVSCFHHPIDACQQDFIHIMLGRGFLVADEAFVIGFTLGCCNKVITSEQKLYTFASRNMYPQLPELDESARCILKDAIKLGYISNCTSLDNFDFTTWLHYSISKVRQVAGIDSNLLRAYFAVEKRRYPHSVASQRLLPCEPKMLVS
jgi:hypothetical protein